MASLDKTVKKLVRRGGITKTGNTHAIGALDDLFDLAFKKIGLLDKTRDDLEVRWIYEKDVKEDDLKLKSNQSAIVVYGSKEIDFHTFSIDLF